MVSASKFEYLKNNLTEMAELCLAQVIQLTDALENDDYELAGRIIEGDDHIDELEKENDNLSQNAILEAVASLNDMREDFRKDNPDAEETALKNDPLRFALSAIRITRYFERIGDNVVNCSRAFRNEVIRKEIFVQDQDLSQILPRVVTIMGMAVESLVEEKDRFYGSVQKVEDELDRHVTNFYHRSLDDMSMSRREFADLYRINTSLERIGDLTVNIAMELVRLTTGRDIRHLFPSMSKLLNTT